MIRAMKQTETMQQAVTCANQHGSASLEGRVIRDWQITTVYSDDLLEETDCNSGEKRTLRKSRCRCGQPVLIEYNAHSCRADKKRVFYPDQKDTGWCAFRCKKCHNPVSETVPGAEYGEPHN